MRGIVDDALEKLGLRRSVALTTPRFLTVPSLVARAPVIVNMQARLARLFAGPLPVELHEVTVSLLWRRAYDHDPAHAWLRDQVTELVAEL